MSILDFNHLKKRNVTYVEHFKFAFSTGIRMLISSVFFLIHGIIPIVQIPLPFNLGKMSEYLSNKNNV